jgi:hypothetical protein
LAMKNGGFLVIKAWKMVDIWKFDQL